MGGFERDPAPWALDGVPDGFEAELLARGLGALRGDAENWTIGAVDGDAQVRKLFNGPEAFTPDGEFILGESDAGGLLGRGRLLRARPGRRRRMGWQMAEWIVNGEPSLDLWHMDIRRFGRQYRSRRYSLARAHEVYSTYYDIKYPNRGAPGRPAAAAVAGLPAADRAGRVVRREVGLGACELVRLQRGRRRRVAAPARLGGRALVAGHPRRGDGDPEAAGLFDQSSFAKIEVHGPGAPHCSGGSARTESTAASAPPPTRRC